VAWIRNRPVGLVHRDSDRSFPGYTLFCSARGHHATLLNCAGRIVHRWWNDEGIQHLRLLPTGNLLVHTLPPVDASGVEHIGGSAGALLELDWDGRVVWEYRNPMLHHDFHRLDNGNHLVIAWEQLPPGVQDEIQGGHHHVDDPERMWGDVILEVDSQGRPVARWPSWEHLDRSLDVLCPLESRREWTHANSLEVLPDGRWLVSFRLTSTVVIIEPASGAITWRWGPDELSHQHAATWLGDDRVLVFDNGCHRKRAPAFSRLVEVDVASKEIVWHHHGDVLLSFFSFMVSGAQRLPNGNTLVTEGATGRLFEVTRDHDIVWEYVSPFTLIDPRFGPTPMIFRAYRFPIDDVRFTGRDLEPGRYAALEARFVGGGLPVDEE
jgi:hypothetical protein